RLDVEPQLRGPPGRRRTDASRLAAGRGSHRDRGPHRRRARAGACVKSLRRVTGKVAVLDRADVDTDQIIPKQFLKRIERNGIGEGLDEIGLTLQHEDDIAAYEAARR